MASAGTLSVSILARTKKFPSSIRQVRKEMLDCLYSAEDYISYYLEQIPSGKSNVVKPDKNKGPNPFDQL